MNIKLRQLIESDQPLARLAQMKQPVKVAYRISRAIRLIRPELESFYSQRSMILEKYGDVQDDGRYQIRQESMDQFKSEIETLLDEPVELAIHAISLEDLTGDISPLDIESLSWLIEEPAE